MFLTMASMSPDPLATEVARLLGLLEHHYGAQARLAKRVGISTSAISSWKAMKSAPEPERWAMIEDYFGLPTGHLTSVNRGEIQVGAVEPTRIDGMTILTDSQDAIEPTNAVLAAKLDRILALLEKPVDRRRPKIEAGDGTPTEMPRPVLKGGRRG